MIGIDINAEREETKGVREVYKIRDIKYRKY